MSEENLFDFLRHVNTLFDIYIMGKKIEEIREEFIDKRIALLFPVLEEKFYTKVVADFENLRKWAGASGTLVIPEPIYISKYKGVRVSPLPAELEELSTHENIDFVKIRKSFYSIVRFASVRGILTYFILSFFETTQDYYLNNPLYTLEFELFHIFRFHNLLFILLNAEELAKIFRGLETLTKLGLVKWENLDKEGVERVMRMLWNASEILESIAESR